MVSASRRAGVRPRAGRRRDGHRGHTDAGPASDPVGLYHHHGGEWASGVKGLDACVMLLPDGVSTALRVNSIGGVYAYQCEVLRAAVHAAWVPA